MKHEAIVLGIEQGLAALGQSVPRDAAGRLAALLEELERWNRRINLTAIRDPAEMVPGHVLDSLAVRPFLEGRDIIDVGTGANWREAH